MIKESFDKSAEDKPVSIPGSPNTSVNPPESKPIILYVAAAILLLALKDTSNASPLQTSIGSWSATLGAGFTMTVTVNDSPSTSTPPPCILIGTIV